MPVTLTRKQVIAVLLVLAAIALAVAGWGVEHALAVVQHGHHLLRVVAGVCMKYHDQPPC